MRQAFLLAALLAASMLGGCGSSSSEKATESKSKEAPAAERTLKSFYDAANDADCERACAYLTAQGIRQIVRVGSRAACVRTIDGFSKGSFAQGRGSSSTSSTSRTAATPSRSKPKSRVAAAARTGWSSATASY